MATGQSILNLMEVLDAELQLQPAESDVSRGLVALNAAQDYFESLAALRPKLMGSSAANVSTASGTETTAVPTTLLRIDRIQALNSVTSRPDYDLRKGQRAGGSIATTWPYQIAEQSGRPIQYWSNGVSIYWSPLPDAIYSMRVHGFYTASDITANGTFAYKDIVMLPLAAFAVKLLKAGVDDSPEALQGLAEQAFKPVLDTLSLFNRDGASGFEYTQPHEA
jgi:hypothetical protein